VAAFIKALVSVLLQYLSSRFFHSISFDRSEKPNFSLANYYLSFSQSDAAHLSDTHKFTPAGCWHSSHNVPSAAENPQGDRTSSTPADNNDARSTLLVTTTTTTTTTTTLLPPATNRVKDRRLPGWNRLCLCHNGRNRLEFDDDSKKDGDRR